jgi:hypothetical protein
MQMTAARSASPVDVSRTDASRFITLTVMLAAVLACWQPAAAQPQGANAVASAAIDPQAANGLQVPAGNDPYPHRPECASMFLQADWILTPKQRACDWIQNRMLSMTALAGAAWSAEVSKIRDTPSERGDGFATRFSRKFAQNAFKSTGSYVGGLLFHEDPRTRPPYLIMETGAHPHGFFRRTAHALGANLISYRCDGAREPGSDRVHCTSPEQIKRVPGIAKVVGSLASGASSELWEPNHSHPGNRALRGAASAYASTFANALLTEFKPELNAFAGKTFRLLFGGR